jgi:hypothetical protein
VTDDGVFIYREDSGGLMEWALSPTSGTTPDNIPAHVYQLYSIVFIDGIINVSKEVLDLQQSRAQPSGQFGVPPEEGRAFIQSVVYIPFYDIRLKTLIGVIIHEGAGI